MNEPETPKKGWGWLQWGVVIVVMLLGIVLAAPKIKIINDMANQTSTASQAMQIVMAMKNWAGDHGGLYPDSVFKDEKTTSNRVFRQLYRDGIIMDEYLFGGFRSPFVVDGQIGDSPLYERALEAGENHWMMIRGVKTWLGGRIPLVFENALTPTWPPTWRLASAGEAVRGRTWPDGKIIMGFNDGTVSVETLVSDGQILMLGEATRVIAEDEVVDKPITILDIEEKK
jgi:hypothetical protein